MRLGYIGLGTVVRSLHLPALRQVQATAVGGCDASTEQRGRWERETKTPSYATLEELLERARPDLLVVATPPDSHAELSVQALEAGVHVLCEKPLATSLADADRVLETAARAGRSVSVHHGIREQPTIRALRERIGTPDVGRLVFCQVWQLVDLPPWREPAAWRAAMADRSLLEGGIHLVDLLLSLFGEAPAAVTGHHSSGLYAESSADAVALVTLEFADGRLGHLLVDRLSRGGDRYLEVRADCEQASLRASWGGRGLVQIGKKRAARAGIRAEVAPGGIAWLEQGLRRRTIARDPRRPGVAGTAELLRRTVAAIEAGEEPPSSGRQARAALEVIDGAYRSAATGERVELSSAGAGRVGEQDI
jgi:predicted dehydrogenase